MSTADVAGVTRLDAAKQRVSDLIEQLDSGMSAMIIAFDDERTWCRSFTSNRRSLQEAIQRVKPTAAPTNIRGALDLAAGFANPSVDWRGRHRGRRRRSGARRALHFQRRPIWPAVKDCSLGESAAEVPADRRRRHEQPGDHGVQHAPQRSAAGTATGVRPGRQFQRRRAAGERDAAGRQSAVRRGGGHGSCGRRGRRHISTGRRGDGKAGSTHRAGPLDSATGWRWTIARMPRSTANSRPACCW